MYFNRSSFFTYAWNFTAVHNLTLQHRGESHSALLYSPTLLHQSSPAARNRTLAKGILCEFSVLFSRNFSLIDNNECFLIFINIFKMFNRGLSISYNKALWRTVFWGTHFVVIPKLFLQLFWSSHAGIKCRTRHCRHVNVVVFTRSSVISVFDFRPVGLT